MLLEDNFNLTENPQDSEFIVTTNEDGAINGLPENHSNIQINPRRTLFEKIEDYFRYHRTPRIPKRLIGRKSKVGGWLKGLYQKIKESNPIREFKSDLKKARNWFDFCPVNLFEPEAKVEIYDNNPQETPWNYEDLCEIVGHNLPIKEETKRSSSFSNKFGWVLLSLLTLGVAGGIGFKNLNERLKEKIEMEENAKWGYVTAIEAGEKPEWTDSTRIVVRGYDERPVIFEGVSRQSDIYSFGNTIYGLRNVAKLSLEEDTTLKEDIGGFLEKTPKLRGRRKHTGIDIACLKGTPLLATRDGRVVERRYHGGYGWKLVIGHGITEYEIDGGTALWVNNGNGLKPKFFSKDTTITGEYQTVYAHLSRFLVEKGEIVKQGQVVAKSGNSGKSTGPHLHYEKRIETEDGAVYWLNPNDNLQEIKVITKEGDTIKDIVPLHEIKEMDLYGGENEGIYNPAVSDSNKKEKERLEQDITKKRAERLDEMFRKPAKREIYNNRVD